jgi:hypothetical protein
MRESRGVVTSEDAWDAVLLIAAAIDSAVQSGQMPAGRGMYAMAMLMVVRDYLPLPTVPGPDGADKVTPDLAEMVKMLRQGGSEAGIQRVVAHPRSGPGSAPRCLLVARPAATETRLPEGYGAPAAGDNGPPCALPQASSSIGAPLRIFMSSQC